MINKNSLEFIFRFSKVPSLFVHACIFIIIDDYLEIWNNLLLCVSALLSQRKKTPYNYFIYRYISNGMTFYSFIDTMEHTCRAGCWEKDRGGGGTEYSSTSPTPRHAMHFDFVSNANKALISVCFYVSMFENVETLSKYSLTIN